MAESSIIDGVLLAFSLTNLLVCLLGVAIGTVVGVLPGLGPVSAISILLPVTLQFDSTTALIFIAGIYFGGMYGGSTTSILVNIPGTAANVVTCIDGYPLGQKGRAGAALVITAIASFVGGTIGMIFLSYLAPTIAKVALKFGPIEYFSIVLVGLVVLARLTDTSFIRSFLLITLGVVLSTIGMDTTSGAIRLTFGIKPLIDGFSFIPIIMGLYGLTSILLAMEKTYAKPIKADLSLRKLMPTREELKRSSGPIARGGLLGFFVGLTPGPASIIGSYASYKLERNISKRPEEFGKGAIEGLAGPETANNASSTAQLVPLLSLGIPFSPLPAILLTAFVLHGVTPGPLLMVDHSTLFWALIASMYIGNIMLLVLNIPLVGLFAKILHIPTNILMPLVLVFCFIGAYSVNYNLFDLVVLVGFGIFGYLLSKANLDPSPLILGIILGPMLELNFAQSMILLRGNMLGFLDNPISLTILTLGLITVVAPIVWNVIKRRKEATIVNE